LFATDRFPSGRVNIYSKPDLLAFVRHVFRDTKEFEYIKASCFGTLFELPTRQCHVSCKLIHALLTRQLICDDKNTLRSIFGADPLRFDLQEFGKKKSTTIVELHSKLENEANMPGWKKLRLALLIIVDGVLIAHQQSPLPTPRYVEMVKDVEAFCSHPWRREFFLKTIICMKLPKFIPRKCEDPIGTLLQLLNQETYKLKGFPLALQLLAFRIEVPFDTILIMELDEPHLTIFPALSKTDILRWKPIPTWVFNSDFIIVNIHLKVTSLIPVHNQPQPGWGVEPDVYDDSRLSFMEQLLADHQSFKKTQWPHGPFIIYPSPHDNPVAKKRSCSMKHQTQKKFKPTTSSKKVITPQKQRSINSYYLKSGSSNNSNDQVLEMLSASTTKIMVLEVETKRLHKLIKRRKTRTHSKHSSFHSLLSRSKKFHKSDKRVCCPYGGRRTSMPLTYRQSIRCKALPLTHPHDIYPHLTCPHLTRPHIPHPIYSRPQQSRPHLICPQLTCPHISHLHAVFPHISSSPYDTSAHPLNLQDSPPHFPKKSSLQDVIFGDVEIHSPISPDPQTPTQPKYDFSTKLASHRPPLYPLSPLLYTPDTSPNNSSDNVFGFAVHVSSVNAFAARTTSNPGPNDTATIIQAQFTLDGCVELSDSSPARPTPGHIPSLEESHLAKEIVHCPSIPALALISLLPQIQWDHFQRIISASKIVFHITPLQYDFSNDFLLQLAEPQKWTTTYHMAVLMHMLASRHSLLLQDQKLAFTSPYLASGMQEKYRKFTATKDKNRSPWDKQLTELPCIKWLEDVFTVYTPMIWSDSHWVGLAINIDFGLVEILDPFTTLNSERKAARYMATILKSLPYFVKKVVNYQPTQFHGLAPFTWSRLFGLYINSRGGDCGPVTVKFLEIHAHGDPAPHMYGLMDHIGYCQVLGDTRTWGPDTSHTIVLPAYYSRRMMSKIL
ncbi:LOW QUALITY PROTEIN: hypothetical protein N665_0113s0012, partial [Sinapis alba]